MFNLKGGCHFGSICTLPKNNMRQTCCMLYDRVYTLQRQAVSCERQWVCVTLLFTRKEISRFSPPQMSMPLSYWPSSLKYFLSMANRPPAMVGDLRQGEGVKRQNVSLHSSYYSILWSSIKTLRLISHRQPNSELLPNNWQKIWLVKRPIISKISDLIGQNNNY